MMNIDPSGYRLFSANRRRSSSNSGGGGAESETDADNNLKNSSDINAQSKDKKLRGDDSKAADQTLDPADEHGVPNPFEIAIGSENPKKNTIVTDGNGGIEVQLSEDNAKGAPEVVYDGIKEHEQQHIDDIYEYATNLEVLENQPRGRLIRIVSDDPETIVTIERRGIGREINTLENYNSGQKFEKSSVARRAKALKAYYDNPRMFK